MKQKIFLIILFFLAPLSANEQELRAMISQMLVLGFSNNHQSSINKISNYANKHTIGGVYLKQKNFKNNYELKLLIKKFSKHNALIFANTNGGKYDIFSGKSGFVVYPNFDYNCKNLALDEFFKLSERYFSKVSDFGIDINLGLRANVNEYTFTKDPAEITVYANSLLDACRASNLECALISFPANSKQKNYDFNMLRPYFDLIKRQKVNIIMLSRHKIPSLDDENFATFSPKIANELLRDKFNFKGIIMSANLNDSKFRKIPFEKRLISAINAGCDMIFIQDLNRLKYSLKDINDKIYKAVFFGQINEKQIKNSYMKIIKLKDKIHNVSN